MTVYVVAMAGRQVENPNRDDNFVFMVEKAFRTAAEAQNFVREKGTTAVQTVESQYGTFEVLCQRSITPLEIPA